MRNITLFKGAKGDHKALNIYINKGQDKYKQYIMLEFWNTKKSQTVQGKTVGDFTDRFQVTFGMEMWSGHDEIGAFMRFLQKDATILKDKKMSFLHKVGDMEKSLYCGQFDNGGHYVGIRNKEGEKINIALSWSEMLVINEYIKNALHMYRYTDVFETPPANDQEHAKPAAETASAPAADDDLPF